jgi:hypothetical protein
VASLSTSTSTGLSTAYSAIAVLNTIDTTPIVIVTTGQSNAVGQRDDGPNPADPNVKVWDRVTNAWGSSDITQTPFSRSQPDGNLSKNSVGLSFAHRMSKETKRPVYLIHDAYSGKPIEDWMGAGTASVRYAALATKVVNALATPELAGVNEIDYLLWTQGEENALVDQFNDYLPKFTTLDVQFRAESWMGRVTPMLVFGLSNLHKRYQIVRAQEIYCANKNPNCIYVNSSGLETQTTDMVGDMTHFTGAALWEHGYYRGFSALSVSGGRPTLPAPTFYSRGVGDYDGDGTAIANFTSLVSKESATDLYPINSLAAVGSIAWGFQCGADGNYTFAGGYQTTTANLCNYSIGWGRSVTFSDAADYSAGFGFQQSLLNENQFAAGRGHTLADAGASAFGMFSVYTTAQADKVIYQLGNGTTSANRSNVIAARQSGIVELQGSKVRFTPTAFYNYAASMTADTVGDIRTIKVGNELQVQKCTVANVNQGAGTWVQSKASLTNSPRFSSVFTLGKTLNTAVNINSTAWTDLTWLFCGNAQANAASGVNIRSQFYYDVANNLLRCLNDSTEGFTFISAVVLNGSIASGGDSDLFEIALFRPDDSTIFRSRIDSTPNTANLSNAEFGNMNLFIGDGGNDNFQLAPVGTPVSTVPYPVYPTGNAGGWRVKIRRTTGNAVLTLNAARQEIRLFS